MMPSEPNLNVREGTPRGAAMSERDALRQVAEISFLYDESADAKGDLLRINQLAIAALAEPL